MASPARRSALAGHLEPGIYGAELDGGPGVTLSERRPAAILQLNGTPEPAALHGALQALGLTSAPRPNGATGGERADLLWNGPNQWLAVSEAVLPAPLADELRAALADTDSTVMDVSHARTVLRIQGHAAKTLIGKGCPADVESMQAGDCLSSLLGPFTVLVHCLHSEQFDIYVFRSFGLAIWEWLTEEAAEFGYEVKVV